MPASIQTSIGMPTICQCVYCPIRNIGACENTPAMISVQPNQKAMGWWNDRPLDCIVFPVATDGWMGTPMMHRSRVAAERL